MAWTVTSDPRRFVEAIEWFRARVPISEEAFAALTTAARRKAFTVAAVAFLDVVAETQESLNRSIDAGESFVEWKAQIADRLRAAWATQPGRVPNPGHRLETIFRTNVQLSYSAGRYRQLEEPAVKRARPYRLYDAIQDARTTELCNGLNGTVLAADDPWWQSHWPPLHFACRSGVRSLRPSQAEERGVTQVPPGDQAQDGFGLTPDATEWTPDLSSYPADLQAEYQRRVTERDE